MILYATLPGGKYVPFAEAVKSPADKLNLYVNITNRCNCACVFCLRGKKKMAAESSLWLKEEPTVEEVKTELDKLPWENVAEVVFCGFGEPTMRQEVLLELLRYVKEIHPEHKTRLNTNGLGNLQNKRSIAADFGGVLDIVSISLNASNAKRYFELTRSTFGEGSFEAMLSFAEDCKAYVPQVVLTVVDKVEDSEEITKCRAICEKRNLTLRVRTYEDS